VKKRIHYGVLLALICICGVLGFMNFETKDRAQTNVAQTQFPTETIEEDAENTEDDLFASLRLQRKQDREEEFAMLREILDNDDIDREAQSSVAERYVALTEYYEAERTIEQQLILRGYAEAFAFVQDDLVTVAVKGKLTEQETAFIARLTVKLTGFSSDRLTILPIA